MTGKARDGASPDRMPREGTKGSPPKSGFSRRAFLQGSGAAAAATALHQQTAAVAREIAEPTVLQGKQTFALNINGQDHNVTAEPRDTLLNVLRYQLDLTGAKPVSEDGSSGASTVLIDGKPVMASTTFAIACRGKKIQTAEGLAQDAVPAAFVEHDAQQCGFCTPGFVVAVRAFLDKNPNASEAEIREGINGNICRCGTYANIMQACVALAKGGQNG